MASKCWAAHANLDFEAREGIGGLKGGDHASSVPLTLARLNLGEQPAYTDSAQHRHEALLGHFHPTLALHASCPWPCFERQFFLLAGMSPP